MTALKYLPALLVVFAAGCATRGDVPLIFGTSNTVGISMGGTAAEQGADITIGYKSQDFALVPVTIVQPDGTEQQIGSAIRGDSFRDSFSVLGQFETSASRSSTTVTTGLGKFFATGVAAKKLSDGFAKKLGAGRTTVDGCTDSPAQDKTATNASPPAKSPEQTAKAERPAAQQAAPAQQPSRQERPGAVMIFAQYEALGFSIGGSATQQGVDLTLGLKDRNLAIVPVISREAGGRGGMIRGKVTNIDSTWPDPIDEDALSVLGQFTFDAKQDSGTFDSGLGKFFSTGSAAQKLSDGFKVKLCEQYQAANTAVPAPEQKKP